MASLNHLRENMDQAAHEYMVALAMSPSTFPKGYGNVQVKYKLNCENKKLVFFTDSETIEKTIKP
jgi:hypothetical protein